MRNKKRSNDKIWLISIVVLVMASMACGLITNRIESVVEESVAELEQVLTDVPLPSIEDIPMTEDLVFPAAEFLFEVIPFGTVEQNNNQHAIRWRIFSSTVSVDDIDSFYMQQLVGWEVERDEVINNHRYLVLSSDNPLSAVYTAADFEAAIRQTPDMGYALLDIEILNLEAHAEVGRMNIIFTENIHPEPRPPGEEVSIPGDRTLIILVDHILLDPQDTAPPIVEEPDQATPEPEEPTSEPGDIEQACQLALETSLCNNPYFPPIEGLTLVYSVDGQKTQTRQIGPIQRDVQEPGEPPTDSFIVTFIDDDFTVEMEYFCTEEGVSGGDISRMMLSVLEGQEMQDEGFSLDSINVEGVTLPKDISPGDTWESFVEIVFNAPDDAQMVATNLGQHFFEGYETITTPAGTFTVQKIVADMDVEVGIRMPDGYYMSLTSMQMQVVSYNAECYGMIRSESETHLELIDIIMP